MAKFVAAVYGMAPIIRRCSRNTPQRHRGRTCLAARGEESKLDHPLFCPASQKPRARDEAMVSRLTQDCTNALLRSNEGLLVVCLGCRYASGERAGAHARFARCCCAAPFPRASIWSLRLLVNSQNSPSAGGAQPISQGECFVILCRQNPHHPSRSL
jgi:hypothetical protein